MNRDYDSYHRFQVLQALAPRLGIWLSTLTILRYCTATGNKQRVRIALRQLRAEGYLDRRHDGWWKANALGRAEIPKLVEAHHRFVAWKAKQDRLAQERYAAWEQGQAVPLAPMEKAAAGRVPSVTTTTFEEILKCGHAGGKMLGAKLMVTEPTRAEG
jgi:hypothetical protein